MRRIFLAMLLAFAFSSCAHVISRDTLQQAKTDVIFSDVMRDPMAYDGTLFVWGGIVVETRLIAEGSEIEVVQSPLDGYGAIIDDDVSYGRFFVSAKRHLDPLIYEEGRQITVAGVLIGSKRKRLGDTEYIYPILQAKEIHLWKKENYYGPGYYDPWFYDPWYYDRWYYGPRHLYRY